ncbi:hypothetical protein [Massilia pseudoviolaceinigra]|uniref:hypothetical protein n=1 Tax=Massilia pseudoviolaceinigra TaxID=3057165 RepID=UPI0027967EAB|nr:hypothetical protein [Massilia sp. CCM 9206]MDQ1925061.1 hypothetical protein [Massilia sp. CCM 9206]
MNWLKAFATWVTALGTVLVFSESVLSFYKVVEFRAAVHDPIDLVAVIFISLGVVLAASFALMAITSLWVKGAKGEKICRISGFISAGFAIAVLILNSIDLREWPLRALEGRNFSAAWCLLVSCVRVFARRRLADKS